MDTGVFMANQRLVGVKDKFALEYQLLKSPYEERFTIANSYGNLKVWINAIDICEYYYEPEQRNYQYEANLFYVAEWLIEHLDYILGFDLFPLKVGGDNILEMLKKSLDFDSGDQIELDLWYNARSRWILNHSWLGARDGSILCNIHFRRIDDQFEIAWDNHSWAEDGWYFKSKEGIFLLDHKEARSIITEFLKLILGDLIRTELHENDKKELMRLNENLKSFLCE